MVRIRIQDRPKRVENYEVFEERNKKWTEELEIQKYNPGKTPGKKNEQKCGSYAPEEK